MAGKLKVYEDTDLPAGSVVVAVAVAETGGADLGLSVARKNTDRPFLGPHGWQAGEHVFTPYAVRAAGSGSEMIFGSDVTRHIGVDMNVTLAVPTLGISERHFWPSITAAPGEQGVNIYGTPKKPEPVIVSKPRVEPGGEPIETAGGAMKPAVEPLPPPPVEDFDLLLTPDPDRRKRRWWIPAAAAIVLLLLCGALAYLYLRQDGPAARQASAPASPAVPAAPAQPDFASRYRDYLGQSGQGEALLALGREALAADATEVGFNAVTLSADRGFAPAKLQLAQWYDPLVEPRGPARANANNAAVYYAEASTGGMADAAAALQRLCQGAKTAPVPDWAETFDTRTHCP